jgi:hypothetical protein
MRDAQVLVRASRLSGGGGSLSAFGFGGGATRTHTIISPRDLMIDGPRVLRDLMLLVRDADARGVVLHVNNLETLSEADTLRAAETFRGLRDPMLMHDGLHYVVVGTLEAIATVVNTYQQVRNIFSTVVVVPFELRDVNRMLTERYKHLRLDESRPFLAPADHPAVAELHALFRGDLRGLLKALEDGITPLLGIAGTTSPRDPGAPASARSRSTRSGPPSATGIAGSWTATPSRRASSSYDDGESPDPRASRRRRHSARCGTSRRAPSPARSNSSSSRATSLPCPAVAANRSSTSSPEPVGSSSADQRGRSGGFRVPAILHLAPSRRWPFRAGSVGGTNNGAPPPLPNHIGGCRPGRARRYAASARRRRPHRFPTRQQAATAEHLA